MKFYIVLPPDVSLELALHDDSNREYHARADTLAQAKEWAEEDYDNKAHIYEVVVTPVV